MKPLHLLKLSVGTTSIDDLRDWYETRPDPLAHVTRMWPRRADEIAGIGSIYWVIMGEIQARQRILRFDERIGADEIRRVAIVLDRTLIPVKPTPRRPFQGWRYLNPEDAPPDIDIGDGDVLPHDIEAELNRLGLG